MKKDDDSLRTSWTAVAGLKNTQDAESWERFYARYRPLIFGLAAKAGLRQEEAQEVVQETMLSVSKHIQDFIADPARGSFRAWLLQMAKWRIQDQFRKRLPLSAGRGATSGETATTPTVERVPDNRPVDLEGLCDEAWKEWLMARALKEVQVEVKAEHFQVFHLLVVERKSTSEVARIVGRNRAQIYLIKHRVSTALKKVVRRIEREMP